MQPTRWQTTAKEESEPPSFREGKLRSFFDGEETLRKKIAKFSQIDNKLKREGEKRVQSLHKSSNISQQGSRPNEKSPLVPQS